jgi:KRAB domain-containing zinc finger protein
LHEENSKQEEEEEDKKTSIKPAIPKHTCSLCDYQTNKKPLLKAHEKTHSNTYDWKCPQCNYKAYREYNLIHENIRYHCDLCSYTTTRTNYLKDHIKFIHKSNEKTL